MVKLVLSASPRGNGGEIPQFIERLKGVSGEYYPFDLRADFAGQCRRFFVENQIKKVVLAGPPLPVEAFDMVKDSVEVLADFHREDLTRERAIELCAQADAGLTGIDAVIADTGTIVCGSVSAGDRLVSLLPPMHIALAFEAPVFPDLMAFLQTCPNFLTYVLITGPSRTADIEKQLVLGAHGPKRLVVWGPAAG